jgi:hypothetical protein
MRAKNLATCIIVIFSGYSATQATQPDQGGMPTSLIWEKNISPYCAAEDLYTLHAALYTFEEDVLAPNKTLDSTESGAAFRLPFRLARFMLLDLPIDYMPMLIQHEVFGHGYRGIEAGYRDASYSLHFPPPFEDGHGYAQLANLSKATSRDQDIVISAGGIEANDVFADNIRRKWIVTGSMNHHDATLYIVNAFNRSSYAARTRFGFLNTEHGNDIVQYLRLVNLRHGGHTLDDRPMDVEDLQIRMAVDALDPFAFYALWTVLLNHIVHGRPNYAFPVPEIAGTRILPLAHAGLAPFGIEYYLEALMTRKSRSITVTYRQGDPGSRSFYGMGIEIGTLLDFPQIAVDLRVEAWRQPELRINVYDPGELGETPEAEALGEGIWATIRTKSKVGLVATLGYKARGFVQGEGLDEGVILRAGISFLLPALPNGPM